MSARLPELLAYKLPFLIVREHRTYKERGSIMAYERILESIQKFYRIAAFSVSLFYVAVILVPYTLVLIVRRVLAEVEIPSNGPLEHAQQVQSPHATEGLAIEGRTERR